MTIRYIKTINKFTDNSEYVGKDNLKINVFDKRVNEKERRCGSLVMLFNQKKYSLVCAKATNADGVVSFNNLNLKDNLFMVIAHDYKKEFNAVIADNISGATYVDD